LDEVEKRLSVFCGEASILVRGRDSDGERNTNFLEELKSLALSEPIHVPEIPRDPSLQIASQTESLKRHRKNRMELELELATMLDRLQRIGSDVVSQPPPWYLRWIYYYLQFFGKMLSRSKHDLVGRDISLPNEVEKLYSKLATMDPMPSAADFPPHDPAHKLALSEALSVLFKRIASIDYPSRAQLQTAISELEFSDTKPKPRNLTDEDARLLLAHRPVWLISTLSVPSRVPLIPGLFDLLVIDEASQCDIASSLPLFHRAKRAAVVGDPLQLDFVPGLSLRQEHALMDHAGLPKIGRAAIAQSKRSLFEFADSRPTARHHFLADQFRSAGDIVDYLNDGFYANKLRVRRSDDQLKSVPGHRPGIDWVDVKGKAQRVDDVNINEAEAKEIARRIVSLAEDKGFDGTIGALTPFVGQVTKIVSAVDALKGSDWRKSKAIKIATIDKFQGGEADVIFFSLVVTAGAPMSAVSFLQKERRRFNVAVSRARAVCIVVGDLDAAKSSTIAHLRKLAWHATRPQSELSHEMDSRWEEILYGALKKRGYDPIPQYEIGRRRLDFALFSGNIKLDIEVDGRAYHTDPDGQRKVSDLLRDKEMIARGWKVRRFWVSELERNMEKCLDLIDADLKSN
jgi:very-short-patch-repair endonuclease